MGAGLEKERQRTKQQLSITPFQEFMFYKPVAAVAVVVVVVGVVAAVAAVGVVAAILAKLPLLSLLSLLLAAACFDSTV